MAGPAGPVSAPMLGFVKSTFSIGCVGTESNAPVDSNAGEPTRQCTSGKGYFGTEDGTSVESSTGEPSKSSCAAPLVPKRSSVQMIGVALAELPKKGSRVSKIPNFPWGHAPRPP